MPAHAQLAAKLLRDAATFFRNVGAQNPALAEEMNENAAVYEQVADLTEMDPLRELPLGDDPE
jgi:DeoR/GlpR family transcriptional regulator of sugar metabolism